MRADPRATGAPTDEPVAAPASGPVFSVLVRSMGRPGLQQALDSLAAQTTPLAGEVVVVNASGRPHPPLPARCGPMPVRLVDPGRALVRPAAANAALDAARGEWLIFLDDDDTLDPAHLGKLLHAARGSPGVRAVYTGVRLLHADGRDAGVLDEPFDARRLWLANFLPIHAVLFHRALCAQGCRFDESLPVYEDWDFWQQVARLRPLQHVPGVSASYRLVGDSGLSAQRDEALSQAQRRAFYRKWLPRLDADEAERVAAYAEVQRGRAVEALRAAGAAQLAEAERRSERDAARTQADAAREEAGQLAHALREAQGRAQALQDTLTRRDAELQAALATYAQLEAGYRAVTGSLSWRVTAPLRGLRQALQRAHRLPGRGLRGLWRALPLSPSGRQRVKLTLTALPGGQALLRRLAPHAVASAAPPAPAAAPIDKEAVRREAEAALTRFLAGDDRLLLGHEDESPEVSVIVVMFNQAGLSLLCLQSLAASRGVGFETLLVDNGSSDRVPELLHRVRGAQVLRPGENLGFLRAVNRAAAQARGEFLLLLNNDAMVEPDTLAAAVRRLRRDPGAAAVGGPILLWDGRLQEAGSIVWRDGSCLGYGRGDDPTRPAYRHVRDVDYCSGAFLLLRREWFERLGGFDDAYAPAYYEESDLCVRLWEHGQRVVYDPEVRVRHFEFASEVASGWAIELQTRNRARFVERHAAFLQQQAVPDAASIERARQRLAPGGRRVLVIDDRVPLPWMGQGYPRAARLVAALAGQGHAVTHYPLQFPRENAADVARALPETVEVLLDHGLSGLLPLLQQRRGLYDCVVVSRPHNMQVLRALLQRHPALLGDARVVYDAEAMFSLRDAARAALDGKPWSEAERRRRVAEELALAQGAHAVLAVSEAEAAHYRAGGFANVQVLGHELEAVPGTPGFASRHGLLFVGALTDDDTPNSDSMRWFIGEVWPRVQAALGPGARMDVVGPCEAPSVRALADRPGVRLHGRVDDLAPWLDAARVFVVPTRYAAGIPHKAHEAAARGLPMVGTPLIAGQLGWSSIIGIGADAAGFAQACVALHEDAEAWARQREAILQAVLRDCSRQAFEAALARALGLPHARPGAPTAGPALASPAAPAAAPTVAPSPAASAAAAARDDERRTAELWGRDAERRADATRALRHWSSHPVTAAEINRTIAGDAGTGWVAHLGRRYFPSTRARGLSLGSGSGAVVIDCLRLGLVQQMEGVDIAEAAVAVARGKAAEAGVADRARFTAANVNALALHGPYDLILFEQSLHHVDAIDAVLDRCRDALAPDGLFVINEYVGPDRFQWSDEAERLMNALLERLPESRRRHPDGGLPKQRMKRTPAEAVIALDPSEAIHSSRILAACEARFEVVERRDFGGTLLQFMLADIAANFDPGDELDVALMRLMSLLEAELIRAGAIGSDFVFAVYRRR